MPNANAKHLYCRAGPGCCRPGTKHSNVMLCYVMLGHGPLASAQYAECDPRGIVRLQLNGI